MADAQVRQVAIPVMQRAAVTLYPILTADGPTIETRTYPLRDIIIDTVRQRAIYVPKEDDPSILPGWQPSRFAWGSFPL
jgi:predicted GTPase